MSVATSPPTLGRRSYLRILTGKPMRAALRCLISCQPAGATPRRSSNDARLVRSSVSTS